MSDELAPHEERLGETMEAVIEYAAFELNGESAEGAVLAPLGAFPRSAEAIAMSLVEDDHPYIRSVGALIPGYTPKCDPEVLEEIWHFEVERRGSAGDDHEEESIEAPGEDIEEDDEMARAFIIAGTNSVAERILMSAVRWLEMDELKRETAVRILSDMVDRTIDGEAWNDAHLALSTLCRIKHPEAESLVERFAAIEDGPAYFASWAQRLRDGEAEVLNAAEDLVKGADEQQHSINIPTQHQKELKALLEAARDYDAAEDEE